MNQNSIKQWFLPDVSEESRKKIIDNNILLINRLLPLFTLMTTALLLIYSVLCISKRDRYFFAMVCIAVCVGMFGFFLFIFRNTERGGLPSEKRVPCFC